VWALRLIEDPRATEPLIDALKDKNRKIRNVAAAALKVITGQNLGRDYKEWQKWWEAQKGKNSIVAKK
jgi:HEAT repeat protein